MKTLIVGLILGALACAPAAFAGGEKCAKDKAACAAGAKTAAAGQTACCAKGQTAKAGYRSDSKGATLLVQR